jgi:hypothetical protein
MSKRNRQLIRRAEREKNNPNFSPYVKHRKHVSGLNKMPDIDYASNPGLAMAEGMALLQMMANSRKKKREKEKRDETDII